MICPGTSKRLLAYRRLAKIYTRPYFELVRCAVEVERHMLRNKTGQCSLVDNHLVVDGKVPLDPR